MTYFQQDRFHEVQSFAAWVYAVLGLTAVVSLGSLAAAPRLPLWIWLYAAVSLALVFNLLCLRTTVADRELVVTLGALLPLYRRRVALREIASAEAVTYSPLAEYGGWGIRRLGQERRLERARQPGRPPDASGRPPPFGRLTEARRTGRRAQTPRPPIMGE